MQKKRRKSKSIKLDERYFAVRKECFEIMHDASQAFDKGVFGLSTASLGFLSGLLVYKHPLHKYCLVIGASLLLFLAIGFSLYSLWVRQDFSVDRINRLNKDYDPRTKIEPGGEMLGKKMEATQAASGVFFILALILIMCFVAVNYA